MSRAVSKPGSPPVMIVLHEIKNLLWRSHRSRSGIRVGSHQTLLGCLATVPKRFLPFFEDLPKRFCPVVIVHGGILIRKRMSVKVAAIRKSYHRGTETTEDSLSSRAPMRRRSRAAVPGCRRGRLAREHRTISKRGGNRQFEGETPVGHRRDACATTHGCISTGDRFIILCVSVPLWSNYHHFRAIELQGFSVLSPHFYRSARQNFCEACFLEDAP
jgi:hypothetical protein